MAALSIRLGKSSFILLSPEEAGKTSVTATGQHMRSFVGLSFKSDITRLLY